MAPADPLPAATIRRVARLAAVVALAGGVAAAVWAALGDAAGAARLATAALALGLGAGAAALWATKWAAIHEAAAALPDLRLARADWVPPPGALRDARTLGRPVPLPPLAAALAAGVPPAKAAAAWLAELVRRHVLRLATADPPLLAVGPVAPSDPWSRLAVDGPPGSRVAADDAAAGLLAHAAIELHRRLAGAPIGPTGAWFASAFAAAATGGAHDDPWTDALGVGVASRGFARDCAAALDPTLAFATPWVPALAAALAPQAAAFAFDAPVVVLAPADAWHTAACADASAGGAVVVSG